MRDIRTISVLSALFMTACAAETGVAPWEGLPDDGKRHVQMRLDQIAETAEPDGAVLFVGDSITEGADLPSLFPGVAVSNHGIGWDPTQGVLKRMAQVTRGNPERIFLMIGTNDLSGGETPEAIAGRTRDILDSLSEAHPGVDIYLQSVYPRQSYMKDKVAELNGRLSDMASATDGVHYLDLHPYLANSRGSLDESLTYDGLHLNAEGYRVLGKALEPCVRTDACKSGLPGPLTHHVRMLGRYVNEAGEVVIGWPASGFAARADEESSLTLSDPGGNFFEICVDGDCRAVETTEGEQVIPLTNADGGNVVMRRRSESFATGLTRLISATGLKAPTDDVPARRILFVGDSITAGFGVLGADETCGYDEATSSATATYASITADQFDADFHVVAISGRGAVYNYDDNPMPNMLAHFDLALPDTAAAWDHEAWTPDLVVVSLGTNDWSTYDPDTTFAGNYASLLTRIHAEYPEAKMVSVTGPLLTDERGDKLAAGVAEAVERVAKTVGPVEIAPLRLAESGHIWGCNYHPGPDSMARMAVDLAGPVSRVTGWSAD